MATKITFALEDDLVGGPAEETLRFGIDGSEYEIDLNKKNAKAFRQQLAPFIEHARKAGRRQRRRPVRTSSAAAASGHGRKTRASRSASAGASRRALLSSTKRYETTLTQAPESRPGSTRPGHLIAEVDRACQ
jgi:hypothetical protein